MQEEFSYKARELFTLISYDDEIAFKELYEMYKEKFYGLAFKMTGSEEITKDIIQDIFVGIWKNRKGLGEVENPAGYLFTAAYRRIYQHYRKMAIERKFYESNEHKITTENTTERMVLYRENSNLVSMAVSQLPPQQQAVFRLSKQEGFSRDDVAEFLNISPNTVKNHLAKAVKFVQTYLRNFATILLLIIWGL